MKTKDTDLAFQLAESWENGNRNDVIAVLESQRDPIIACALAFQISACLWRVDGLNNSDLENRIDRLASERDESDEQTALERAALNVVNNWENSTLAHHVSELALVLGDEQREHERDDESDDERDDMDLLAHVAKQSALQRSIIGDDESGAKN